MLSCVFHSYYKNFALIGIVLCVAALCAGCSGAGMADAEEAGESDYIEYNGIRKNRDDLSADTIQWLEWYQSLPEDQQEALPIIPDEFASESPAAAADYETLTTSGSSKYHYREALTDNELFETEELVRLNYEEANDAEVFEVVPDDFAWYGNKGIEDEYTPGNIIIYRILTTENRLNGNGFLIVSIGRHSKSDPWKIINSGF